MANAESPYPQTWKSDKNHATKTMPDLKFSNILDYRASHNLLTFKLIRHKIETATIIRTSELGSDLHI